MWRLLRSLLPAKITSRVQLLDEYAVDDVVSELEEVPAPFGSGDPWAGMRAAVSRATASGAILGAEEALAPEQALALYLADPERLGRQRRLAPGEAADLCLLARPWAEARGRLSAGDVRATLVAGRVVFQRVDEPPAERHPG